MTLRSEENRTMPTETMQFKAELKQVLHIIIHSLYSHKDIFLRELISNASDAIDTVRFQSLTRSEVVEGDSDWKIRIIPDERNGTLTISDNGVGMSRETIVDNLGTIARSGTRAFLESLRQADARDRPQLIGQFGVGFYSAFMVADKVTVVSRMHGPRTEGVKWESDGEGEFRVEPVEKGTRGTDVTLHLRPDDREYLQEGRLRQVVKQYSDFVEHPIVLVVEREGKDGKKEKVEETLNKRKAIWLRPKSEIAPEEYNEFYKHLAHDTEAPAKVIHYTVEGAVEFRALLYVPAHRPFDLLWGDQKKGLHLYIQRVFIMDDCEALLPLYLRFVKGVVDSPDLPLNVSREMLQQSAPLERIKSNLTNKVLRTLEEMKRKEHDAYVRFYRELGTLLKEGVSQDWSNREELAELLLFESTGTEPGKLTDLAGYVERMPVGQKDVYYLLGENRELLEHSPHLESFKARGEEVLLLTEPIDEFVVQALPEYKGKRLKAVDRGRLDEAVDEGKRKAFQGLLDFMKGRVGEVKDVRLSNRLKESAACLVAEEGTPGAHMQELLRRLGRGQELPPAKKILEVNAEHPAVAAVHKLYERDKGDPRLEKYCRLLYDEAVIAEGSKVKDPLALARLINELLVKDASS
jgi:molecular chaperone HtpG